MYNVSTEFDNPLWGTPSAPDCRKHSRLRVQEGKQNGYYPTGIMGSARLPMEAPPQNSARGHTI